MKQLKNEKFGIQKQISSVEVNLNNVTISKIRSDASSYVVDFLQIVDQLISGTSEGNPAVNGQTLEEEKNAHGDGDWVDLYHRVIRFDPEEWSIPYWDTKLYGGQQFERLLAEYKEVSTRTNISELTEDDVATSTGVNKITNVPNYLWAAADLSQQKAQDAFVPLLEQLTSRALFILKRLTEVAEKIMESRRRHDHEGTNFPYFQYHVKDLFYKYCDNISKVCKDKCMDEFYSTDTILWDLQANQSKNIPIGKSQEETNKAVIELSAELFNSIRQRVTTNTVLKFYNFFLVPLQKGLWNEIQSKISSLDDSELDQLFQLETNKLKLKEKTDRLNESLKRINDQETKFTEHSNAFGNPLSLLL